MTQRVSLVGAAVATGVILVILIVVAVVEGVHLAVRHEDLGLARRQEQRLRLTLQQLRALAQQAPQNQERLAALQAEVPATADLPGLIRLLNTAAQSAGVEFASLSPGQPAVLPSRRASLIPTQIGVVGDFFSVNQYLLNLESLPRVPKVTSISVSVGEAGPTQLQVVLNAEFFTTDLSAGPGSVPGPTGPGATPAPGARPSPSPSTPPGPSPSAPPTLSPSLSPGPSPSPLGGL